MDQLLRCSRACLLIVSAVTAGALPALTQWQTGSISATATVRLIAVKPSSISVSVHQVPLAFDFSTTSIDDRLVVPITTTWNVNPREVRGLEVVAYFRDPELALISEHLDRIAARHLLGRVDNGPYRPFIGSTTASASASLMLLSLAVEPGKARDSREQILELRLDTDHLQNQPKGRYTGTLLIEARYY